MRDWLTDREPPDLRARADALEEAAELAHGRLDDEVVDRAVEIAGRVRSRLRHGTERTVVALAGPTGAGKSSLFNALVGDEVSSPGVRRPTTGVAHAALWGGDEHRLLRWLEIPRRHLVVTDDRAIDDPDLDGLVLVDLPDVDSVEVDNRQEASRLIEVVDLMVWVLDPEKYADASVHHGHIEALSDHEAVLRFVLTKVDLLPAEEVDTVVDDLRSRLREVGLHDPVVWPVSLAPADGDVDAAGLGTVRAALAEIVAGQRAANLRLDRDLERGAAPLAPAGDDAEPVTERVRVQAVEGVAGAAQVDAVADAVAENHRRLARRRCGWLPVELVRRRRPSPVAEVIRTEGVDRIRVEASLRDAAEAGGEALAAPWDDILRREMTDRADDLATALRTRTLGVADRVGTEPRWWAVAAWLQRALLTVVAVGAVWLAALAVFGGFGLDTDVLNPDVDGLPVPLSTAVFLAGVLGGVLLGLLARIPAALGARRRGRATRRRLRVAVGEVVDDEIMGPVGHVLADRARLGELVAVAAGAASEGLST